MSKTEELEHEFVDQLPDELNEGVLYVSMEFGTAAHLCCCGCGTRVLTPLRPNRWRMTFDGERIWLCPSIGNWNFDCKSHYWVQGSKVRWAAQMSPEEVKAIRERSREGWVPPAASATAPLERTRDEPDDGRAEPKGGRKRGRWERVKQFFSR
jgi:hypothetical protein